MQEVWQGIHGVEAQDLHRSRVPPQGRDPGLPEIAGGPARMVQGGRKAALLHPDPHQCRHFVSSLTTVVILILGAAAATVLVVRVQAVLMLDKAPVPDGAIRSRCFKATWKQSAEARLMLSNEFVVRGGQIAESVVFTLGPSITDPSSKKYTQRVVAPNGSPAELPLFIEQACGAEPSREAAPTLLCKWAFLATPVACAIVLGVISFSLHFWVSLPLQRLTKHLEGLGNDHLGAADGLASNASDAAGNLMGNPSWISEVYDLQKAVKCLTHGMERFSPLLPVNVTRKIALNNDRCSLHHVLCRDITIMLSDLQDFSKFSGMLPPRDLLAVMSRYLSVMNGVVEMYNGTVAETQGDGLLVLWNATTSVKDCIMKGHGVMACKTALAMQHALALLNPHFKERGLPLLSMQIGLHSGSVLSDISGSKSRTAFGSIEDSVNLVRQLKDLCTYYGVGAVCAMTTFESLPSNQGFLVRRLDTVSLGAAQAPLAVHELMCRDDKDAAAGGGSTARMRERAHLYERALNAYQAGCLLQARDLAAEVLQKHPEDLAADKLLRRARAHLDEYGGVRLSNEQLVGWTGILAMDEK